MNNTIWCIIPSHGAGDAFIECIESLINQTVKPAGIIIVNNNISDGSLDKLLLEHKITKNSSAIDGIQLKIIQSNHNTGVTGGRNAGIDALPLEYDFACFVDHDMICEPTLLGELIKTAVKRPDIGIVTPKVYYYENKKMIWSAGTDINRTTGQTIFYGGEDEGQYQTEREVAVAPAILFVKKQVLTVVAHFDTRYFATYEDTDFCFSAKQKGFLTYYAPNAIAYHKIPYDPQSAMLRLLERSYWVGRNRYIFLRKFRLLNVITVIFIPIYAAYYLFLAIKYNRLQSFGDYCRGLIAGLIVKV